jgi:hypothetical protein
MKLAYNFKYYLVPSQNQSMFSFPGPYIKAILYSWIIVAVIVFLCFIEDHGALWPACHSKWGPLVSNKWGWMIMELPVLDCFISYDLPDIILFSFPYLIMIGLFSLHYINRIFIFPFRLHTKGKKMPVLLCCRHFL